MLVIEANDTDDLFTVCKTLYFNICTFLQLGGGSGSRGFVGVKEKRRPCAQSGAYWTEAPSKPKGCTTAGLASNGEGAGRDSGLLFLVEVEVGEELPHFHK